MTESWRRADEKDTKDKQFPGNFQMQPPCPGSANTAARPEVGIGTALSHFGQVSSEVLRHLVEAPHGKMGRPGAQSKGLCWRSTFKSATVYLVNEVRHIQLLQHLPGRAYRGPRLQFELQHLGLDGEC